MRRSVLSLARAGTAFSTILLAVLVGGCASTSVERGGEAVNRLLAERGAPNASWVAGSDAVPTEPLTLRRSVALAFARSPRILEQYAELGLAAADAREALQLPEIGLGYARLGDGGERQVTRSLSLAFSDLLLLRSRARLGQAHAALVRERVAAALLELEAEVSAAWVEYVTARQSAEVADLLLRAARASAGYARSLHAAGNLPPRALAQELAAESSAQVAQARAQLAAHQARVQFASRVGLSAAESWQVPARLPALPSADALPQNLAERAFAARPDLAAARREAEMYALALRTARAWRWLGEVELGYERESESGGSRLSGPTLHLSLPLFHWNRAGVLRARASLEAARARRAQQELDLRNELALGLDRLTTARRVAETFRDTVVPQREAVYQRTLEEVNFMLAGAFEALSARSEQYSAYQEYLDAVSDYWQAWLELRHVSGGALPAPDATHPLSFEAAPASPPAHDHSSHGAAHDAGPGTGAGDRS